MTPNPGLPSNLPYRFLVNPEFGDLGKPGQLLGFWGAIVFNFVLKPLVLAKGSLSTTVRVWVFRPRAFLH